MSERKTGLDYLLDNLKKDIKIDELYRILKHDSDEIVAMLATLKDGIVEQYKQDPDSVTAVRVVPTKARKTVAWKDVAEEVKIPESIISKHTKVGKPGFSIQQAKSTTNKNETGDNKFISA